VDGVFGEWNAWYACSVTCGGGKQARDRTCNYPDGVPHGANCTGISHEITDCGTDPCPGTVNESLSLHWTKLQYRNPDSHYDWQKL